MLEITIGGDPGFDEVRKRFVTIGGTKLQLEHSLVSLSKWESIFEKAFLGEEENTAEENIMYIYCMITSEGFSPDILTSITPDQVREVNEYFNSKRTATTFPENKAMPGSQGVVTSELIYYWMIGYQIPFECENWFLGRLLTLIHVCQVKAEEAEARANKQKGRGAKAKVSPSERASMIQQQRDLNAERRAMYNTSG